MSDREKRDRSEPDALNPRARVERGVKDQMTAFVKCQSERAAGKELHRVEQQMFIPRSRLQGFAR